MKKIAFLTERLKNGFGVDLVVHEQAKRLAQDHEVSVFAIEVEDEFVKNVPYSVFRLRIPLFFNPVRQDFSSWKVLRKYKHLLKNFDTFIVHTPTFNSWLSLLKKYGKVIVYHHGNSPSYSYPGLKKYRKNIFETLENWIYFRNAHKILTISEFIKKDVSSSLHPKTHVVHQGGNHITEALARLSKTRKEAILKRYFIEENDVLVTYIGRLDYKNNPYKNTQILFDLQRSLDELKIPGKKVKIFAMGLPENGVEKEMFHKGICVIPKAELDELVTILQRSQVYASTSLWEGFNLPLIEAQTLGIPVVAFDLAAHPEVVLRNESGFLVHTTQEFIEKIHDLLLHTSVRKKMSKQAVAFASTFTWEKNIKEVEAFL